MSDTDERRPVRDEDAFDVEAVAAWLREHAAASARTSTARPRCGSSPAAPPT